MIDAYEFEGLEPIVRNNRIIGYSVQDGQGPTQIAGDINDPKTQAEYGYTLLKPVTWKDVVNDNITTFKTNGTYANINDKSDLGYTKLNVNTGDILSIKNQGYKKDIIDEQNADKQQFNQELKKELTFGFNEDRFWDITPDYDNLSDVKEQWVDRSLDAAGDIFLPGNYVEFEGKLDRRLEVEIKARLRRVGNGANITVPVRDGFGGPIKGSIMYRYHSNKNEGTGFQITPTKGWGGKTPLATN